MVWAMNLIGIRKQPVGPRTAVRALSAQADSEFRDLLWRLTHALGEMLAFLWGVGALGAVAMFIAGLLT